MSPTLILGSSSVNRRELLSRLRIPFESCTPDINEAPLPQETPIATAQRLAYEKGLRVVERVLNESPFERLQQEKNFVVIASDQVAFGQQVGQTQKIYDKPITRERAIEQLLEMQDGRIAFITALEVLLINSVSRTIERRLHGGVMTYAMFRPLTRAQIECYVDLDQPLQCAGSAKCESLGIALLSQVESTDPTALIGLPLILLTHFLNELDINVL